MKKLSTLLAVGTFLMAAGSALALPLNENRPFTPNASPVGESSLQTILADNFNNTALQQSSAGVWQTTDGSPAAYAVAFMKGDAGNFGIYSYTTGQEVVLMTNPAVKKTMTFNIDADGNLVDGNGETLSAAFGYSFGFFWRDTTTPSIAYTEDSKNGTTGWGVDSNIRALAYLIPDNTQITGTLATYFAPSGQIAKNDDDWALAFEDLSTSNGSDGDFNDAVFYVKDLDPVPEPGTMVLLGAGLLGLAIYGKRRMNKEV